MTARRPSRPERGQRGFTLLEVLLTLMVALLLATVVIQGLISSGRLGERLALMMRERLSSRRTLALLRSEMAVAEHWRLPSTAGAECGLGGREPVLVLEAGGRTITYSVGAAPSAIWRGMVLMRCGPAYNLAGDLSGGAAQNRVVLDGLRPGGFLVEQDVPGVVGLRLLRNLPLRDGTFIPVVVETEVLQPPG
ncbi:MAG: prepilin-type N-terminal cleavage/methylation domain-containing protein [Cyanobacteriota bacterium]|nr:prepilin-type N-terminal cleavage/methylation domain-containing protein [Cyanobacteriota bacterium]